ncbi:MAG: methyl-accepting chemotaxis protein [Acidobacteriota bacterium]
MKWFLNLTTRMKLFLGFGLILLLLATVITVAYLSITAIQRSQKELFEKDFTITLTLSELKYDINRQRTQMLLMILTNNRSDQEAIERDIKERTKEIDDRLRTIDESPDDPKFFARMQELKTTLDAFREGRETIISLIYGGKNDEAKQLIITTQQQRFEKLRDIAKEIEREKEEKVRSEIAKSELRAEETVILLAAVGLAALLLSFVMVVLLNRVIAGPLKEISKVAERIAMGDLAVNVAVYDRKDEVGTLTLTFRAMVESLRQLTAEISEGINVLAAAASEILAATTQVAAAATETATAVNETTTTVEEVRQTVQVSAQKAKGVSESASKAAQVSLKGKKSVEQSINGMERIREQMQSIATSIVRLSEQNQVIGEIIATVNDLAEQSNLLAVNAAIEAAKAGEQGRGFTIVAQEVKSLAEQSKQATAQVRTILNDIQKATSAAVMATEQGSKAVEAGVVQSSEAGESISSLADSITEASQAATQIAASGQQQLVGMDQVAIAMENIKQASSQNVASTKQTEIAAQNLHELGQKLKGIVLKYKL